MGELTREFCISEIEKNGYVRIGPYVCDQYADGLWYAAGQDYNTMDEAVDALIACVNNWK